MRTPVEIVNPTTGQTSTCSPLAFQRVWGPAGYELVQDVADNTATVTTNPDGYPADITIPEDD